MHTLTPPLGGAGLILPGRRVFQAGLGASPQSKYSLGFASASSQYVSTGSNVGGFAMGGPFSVSAWIKPALDSVNRVVVANGSGGTASGGWMLRVTSANKLRFILFGPAGVMNNGADSTSALTSGWHHAVGVWTGSAPKVFLDGVDVTNQTFNQTGFSIATAAHVRIGSTPDAGFEQYWQGNLDDVFLSASDQSANAAALAAGTLDPATLTTAGLWRFEEGTGTTAADSSGNGNTGTLTNGPTWSTDVPTQLQ